MKHIISSKMPKFGLLLFVSIYSLSVIFKIKIQRRSVLNDTIIALLQG